MAILYKEKEQLHATDANLQLQEDLGGGDNRPLMQLGCATTACCGTFAALARMLELRGHLLRGGGTHAVSTCVWGPDCTALAGAVCLGAYGDDGLTCQLAH